MSDSLKCPICKKNKLIFNVPDKGNIVYVSCSGTPPCNIIHGSRLYDILCQVYFANLNKSKIHENQKSSKFLPKIGEEEFGYFLELSHPQPVLYSYKGTPISECSTEKLIECIDFLTMQIHVDRIVWHKDIELNGFQKAMIKLLRIKTFNL